MGPPPQAPQPPDRVRAVRKHSTGLPAVPSLPGMVTNHPPHASSMRPEDQANVDDSVAARTLSMPRESPPPAALDSADDEAMEGVDDYHVRPTEVPEPHPHPSRSAKRAQAKNRRCHAARGPLARALCSVEPGAGSGADLGPAPGGRDALRAGTEGTVTTRPEAVISARSDVSSDHGGAGDVCGRGSGNGNSDNADVPFPHDECVGDDNAKPAPYGSTASGGMRPRDGGGGRAAVVAVDVCSIESGSSASADESLSAPSGWGGDIGDENPQSRSFQTNSVQLKDS